MAGKVPLASLAPFWEHAGDQPPKWSTWLRRFNMMISIIDSDRDANRKLTSKAKNEILYSYLGAEGVRRFETDPRAALTDGSHTEFTKAIAETLGETTLPALAFQRFRSYRQEADETANEFVSRLRGFQADCDYANFAPDTDLAIVIAQNCYSRDAQKKLLSTSPVNLEVYVKLLQTEEAAVASADALRKSGDSGRRVQVAAARGRQNEGFQRGGARGGGRAEQTPMTPTCSRCGYKRHEDGTPCPATTAECYNCGKKGHLSKVCRSNPVGRQNRGRGGGRGGGRGRGQVREVNVEEADDIVHRVAVQTVGDQQQHFWRALEVKPAGVTPPMMVKALVDSGADISIITDSLFKANFPRTTLCKITRNISNFDNSPIQGLLGYFAANVSDGVMSCKADIYVSSRKVNPIFGKQIMLDLGLVLDGAAEAEQRCPVVRAATAETKEQDDWLRHIASNFPTLMADKIGKIPGISHKITLAADARPVVKKLRPVAIAYRDAVDKEIQEMEEQGIWRRADGPCDWVHPFVAVKKPGGGVRITTDLTALNACVEPVRHPLPKIQDLFLELRGAKHFTKLDLKKGYFHLELDEQSSPLTTTATQRGLYQYLRLPMGLTDSAAVFQKAVSQALSGCQGAINYIDDILVYGRTKQEHDANLLEVLRRLTTSDFRLNLRKCQFEVPKVKFLGHIVTKDGISPDPENVRAIRDIPPPTTLKQVRSFLGMTNYLKDFVADYVTLAEPLYALTRGDVKSQIKWTPTCDKAFKTMKAAIADNLLLSVFDPEAPTFVTTDASDIGLGAVLSQTQNAREVPVKFASRTLEGRERNYATNEREALGCKWAVEHFQDFLLGRHFTLCTDHKGLETILKTTGTGRKTSKFARWRERLQHFDFDVRYKKGSENQLADALSRLCLRAEQLQVDEDPEFEHAVCAIQSDGFTLPSFQKATAADDELRQVAQFVKKGWPPSSKVPSGLRSYYTLRDELKLDDGCLFRADETLVVPTSMRQPLLAAAHVGHPGIVRAKAKLRETYWWPAMGAAIEDTVRRCTGCQGSDKSRPKQPVPTTSIARPTAPWTKIAIDFTGPFATAPTSQQNMMVIIDYYSSWPEVKLTSKHDAPTVVRWLEEVFSRQGYPEEIVSDNGPEFKSRVFTDFCHGAGIYHRRTPVYCPQQNGLVEVFNRSLKHHIQATAGGSASFQRRLDDFLQRFRAERPSISRRSPAELLMERRLRLPFEFPRGGGRRVESQEDARVADDTTTTMDEAVDGSNDRPRNPSLHTRGPYRVGDKVRVRLPKVLKGASPWSSPRHVERVLGRWNYLLSDGNRWNARRLRPVYDPLPTIDVEDDLPRRSERSTKGRPATRFDPCAPR